MHRLLSTKYRLKKIVPIRGGGGNDISAQLESVGTSILAVRVGIRTFTMLIPTESLKWMLLRK
jgi:hypothetical protein